MRSVMWKPLPKKIGCNGVDARLMLVEEIVASLQGSSLPLTKISRSTLKFQPPYLLGRVLIAGLKNHSPIPPFSGMENLSPMTLI